MTFQAFSISKYGLLPVRMRKFRTKQIFTKSRAFRYNSVLFCRKLRSAELDNTKGTATRTKLEDQCGSILASGFYVKDIIVSRNGNDVISHIS